MLMPGRSVTHASQANPLITVNSRPLEVISVADDERSRSLGQEGHPGIVLGGGRGAWSRSSYPHHPEEPRHRAAITIATTPPPNYQSRRLPIVSRSVHPHLADMSPPTASNSAPRR
jgi:hypothetical protein